MICIYILIILILIVLLSIYVYKESTGYIIHHYKVHTDKTLKDDIKIAFISDLHNYEYGKDNCNIYNDIENYNPDFVVFAGDMITACKDIKFDFTSTLQFIENLSKRWPVYYGVGNHEDRLRRKKEYFSDLSDKFNDILNEIGTPLLIDKKITIDDLNIDIYGLNLDHEYYRKFITKHLPDDYLNEKLGDVDKNRFSILLAHNPEHFDKYSEWNPDLVLSGHVHGGIIRLPLLGGVISPALKLFPKYDGGEFNKNNTKMILSRGAGTHTVPVRVNNKAEIIFIDILR